jgi:Na+-transporting methylmalonyl-CoA/oxaloacetate decarboxylase gamma subunit
MAEAIEMFLVASILIAAVGGLGYFIVRHVGNDDEQD